MANIPKEELANSSLCIVDGRQDAVDQITRAIEGLKNVSVIRILSHGADGEVRFGGQRIDIAMLEARTTQISNWKKSLSADAQILLYGCRVAESNQGKLFVNRLAALTHTNVAASVNPTGAGGDTFLEYKVGEVSSGLLANHADYERAGVSLQLEDDVPIVRWGDIETWHSEITNWTSNQNGTVTVTMAFDLRGEFYYAGDVWLTSG
ncbi:MAG: DUF4347 domain-containing protein, partial [Proteobacteria bacterium]|nr:DUF4347 domain-containing protein [Pseudomonadota bacterium]